MANRSPIESSKQLHNVELNKAPESSFEKPGTVMRWLWNYYDSIFRITLILLLLLSERVVQDKLFVCPYKSTQHNILYSFAFISVPAVVLFGAGIDFMLKQYALYGIDMVLFWFILLCLLIARALF